MSNEQFMCNSCNVMNDVKWGFPREIKKFKETGSFFSSIFGCCIKNHEIVCRGIICKSSEDLDKILKTIPGVENV